MLRIIRVILIIYITVFSFSTLDASGQMFFFQNSLLGEQAPEFSLDTVRSSQVALSQFRGDQPAIIFFWATWCPHCQTQLEELNEHRVAIEEKGIKIILVDMGESADIVKAYLQQHKITFDSFLDTEAHVSEKYRVLGIPTFIFVDKNGIVRSVDHRLPANYVEVLQVPVANKG